MVLPLAALSLALAASCGPSFRPIQVRAVTEAEYLKAEAVAINLMGEDIETANGFFSKAQATEKPEESAAYADLAAAYYRVALARHYLLVSNQALGQSEAALKESQELVGTYKRVLASVNANAGEAK